MGEKAKLASAHFLSTIKLDVGGRHFKTLLKTLQKENSMLSRMFSLNSGFLVEKDEDGFYFIDQPGKYFVCVLDYLQTGVLLPLRDDKEQNGLSIKADFYQVCFFSARKSLNLLIFSFSFLSTIFFFLCIFS